MSNNIVLGIDVSKSSLSLALRLQNGKFYEKTVLNSSTGFKSILKFLNLKRIDKNNLECIMESTGSYSEAIANFLYDNGFNAKVVNPYKIASFAKSKLSRINSIRIAHEEGRKEGIAIGEERGREQKTRETALNMKTETLPDGRIRYYGAEKPAAKKDSIRSAGFVTEFNPDTNALRYWLEVRDQLGTVKFVHPKNINGVPVEVPHYPHMAKDIITFGEKK